MTATAADLKTRFPAFATVPDATVTYWLADAATEAGDLGTKTDAAVMALASHRMATTGATGGATEGVSRFKSGSVEIGLTDAAANRTGLSSTVYGRMYLDIIRQVRGGGPILVMNGTSPTGFVA